MQKASAKQFPHQACSTAPNTHYNQGYFLLRNSMCMSLSPSRLDCNIFAPAVVSVQATLPPPFPCVQFTNSLGMLCPTSNCSLCPPHRPNNKVIPFVILWSCTQRAIFAMATSADMLHKYEGSTINVLGLKHLKRSTPRTI